MKNLETFASICCGLDSLYDKNTVSFFLGEIGKKALKELSKELRIKNPKIVLDKYYPKLKLYKDEKLIMELNEKNLEIYGKSYSIKNLINPEIIVHNAKNKEIEVEKQPLFRITIVLTSFYSRFNPKTAQKEFVNKLEKIIFADIPLIEEIKEINNEEAEKLYELTASIYEKSISSLNTPGAKTYYKNKIRKMKAKMFISKNKEKFAEKVKKAIIENHKPIIKILEERSYFFNNRMEKHIEENVLIKTFLENVVVEKIQEPKILNIAGWTETTDFYCYGGKTKSSGSLYYELYPTGIIMVQPKKIRKVQANQIKRRQATLFT